MARRSASNPAHPSLPGGGGRHPRGRVDPHDGVAPVGGAPELLLEPRELSGAEHRPVVAGTHRIAIGSTVGHHERDPTGAERLGRWARRGRAGSG